MRRFQAKRRKNCKTCVLLACGCRQITTGLQRSDIFFQTLPACMYAHCVVSADKTILVWYISVTGLCCLIRRISLYKTEFPCIFGEPFTCVCSIKICNRFHIIDFERKAEYGIVGSGGIDTFILSMGVVIVLKRIADVSYRNTNICKTVSAQFCEKCFRSLLRGFNHILQRSAIFFHIDDLC